jgi:hypothetical protein
MINKKNTLISFLSILPALIMILTRKNVTPGFWGENIFYLLIPISILLFIIIPLLFNLKDKDGQNNILFLYFFIIFSNFVFMVIFTLIITKY